MLLRHVTVNEIVDAIHEIMGDCKYTITPTSGPVDGKLYNGGYYVNINDNSRNVLLYYANTFYDKLNDYCYMVENPLECMEC